VIRNVTKTFDRTRGEVLKDISLTIPANCFFALLGPSGCGKSTLLRIIAGLEYLDIGEIYLNGENITKLPANKRKVNTVFQNFALFPHLSVYENIAFGLKATGKFREGGHNKVIEKIEALELTGLNNYYPGELSGGQQQRVALARALVNEPDVLLLDEPMSHLDGYLKNKVGQDLLRLQKSLKTIFIMVTHDREEAMTISKEMAILNQGKIVQQGKPKDVFSSPKNTFVAEFMGKANIFKASRTRKTSCATLPFCEIPLKGDWKEAKILINPDCVEILPSFPRHRTGLNVIVRARIEQVCYKGYNVELVCKLLNDDDSFASRLQVLTSNHTKEWEPEEDIFLSINPEKLVVLEPVFENAPLRLKVA
jgi:spermidine/putrescine transport system ATP-binding protein